MVRNPTDMIALGDCVLGSVYGTDLSRTNILHVGGTDRFSFGEWLSVMGQVRALARESERKRHGGTYNVAFCDGHIENLRTNGLFATNLTVLRRWNNDNAPHHP
jgi:prepilin-type processing-associated H-X9-DG protein